jgi:CheY-like chemotaxis protein
MPTVRVLVVDDEDFNRQALRYCLEPVGFEIDEAGDGVEAWALLSKSRDKYDAILLDRRMPEMDGMAVLAKIKEAPDLKDIPVIMQTAMDREEEIIDGIEAGVHYYLTKPYDIDVLVSVVRAATEDYARLRRVQTELAKRSGAIRLLVQGRFELRRPEEADALGVMLASGLPRPAAVAMGLSELLINAIEHGNLELDYANKTEFMAAGSWDKIIAERLQQAPYRDRVVAVDAQRTGGQATFTVTDEGKGFDWRAYMDLTKERVFDTHGRGIAMARKLAFSSLAYQGRGNVVEATVAIDGDGQAQARRQPAAPSGREDPPKPVLAVGGSVPAAIEDRLRSIAGWTVVGGEAAAGTDDGVLVIAAAGDPGVSPLRLRRGAAGGKGDDMPVPADPDLIEAVARALVLPQTLDIGGADEARLSPVLAGYQKGLAPDPAALASPTATVSAWATACTGVSGDTWGGKRLADGRLVVFVADMTGHGPVAGVNTLRLHALLDDPETDPEEAPDAVLRRLDGALKAVLPPGEYAAMIYGILDPGAGRFDYAAAGVPHPVAFDADGGFVAAGSGKGLPVGASGVFPYEKRSLDLAPGGALVLFTDGLFSLVDRGHPEADTFDRFLAAMDAMPGEGPAARRLGALIAGFDGPCADDVTVLCLDLAH